MFLSFPWESSYHVYVSVTSKCKMPLRDWINSDPNPFLVREKLGEVHRWRHLDTCISSGGPILAKVSSRIQKYADWHSPAWDICAPAWHPVIDQWLAICSRKWNHYCSTALEPYISCEDFERLSTIVFVLLVKYSGGIFWVSRKLGVRRWSSVLIVSHLMSRRC